jgi:hypothetical protein
MTSMASWNVTVFDEATEELVAEHATQGIDAAEVRRLWQIPPSEPIMELPVGEEHLPFIAGHVVGVFDLRAGQSAFLGLCADYPGETVDL